MTERPILFMDSMVRAIMGGRKTVTRRVGPTWARVKPGDRLWVREAHCSGDMGLVRPGACVYRADYIDPPHGPWRPSIHMPRSVCRLLLDVVSVTEQVVQAWGPGEPGSAWAIRLPDVDDAEALREGFASRDAFIRAWQSMHPNYAGPVWRIEFARVTP